MRVCINPLISIFLLFFIKLSLLLSAFWSKQIKSLVFVKSNSGNASGIHIDTAYTHCLISGFSYVRCLQIVKIVKFVISRPFSYFYQYKLTIVMYVYLIQFTKWNTLYSLIQLMQSCCSWSSNACSSMWKGTCEVVLASPVLSCMSYTSNSDGFGDGR